MSDPSMERRLREAQEQAQRYRDMLVDQRWGKDDWVWVLTVPGLTDPELGHISVHRTRDAAVETLRDEYAEEFVPRDDADHDLVLHLVEQYVEGLGIAFSIDNRFLPPTHRPDRWTLELSAVSIAEHFADDPDDERRAFSLAIPGPVLQAAGEVVINQLSDEFFAAVDDLFDRALSLAQRTAEEPTQP